MSDSTLLPTPEAPDSKHEAQGTILPPTPTGTPVAPVAPVPVPKRNHNHNAMSGKPKLPLTTEQQQQATSLAAAGWSQTKIAKTIGRSRNAVKHYLEKPEAIAEVRDEKQELAVLYREKARACVTAIDDDKIKKSSALQLATSSGILLDKSLLLGGQPTVNVAVLVDLIGLIRQNRDAEDERHCKNRQRHSWQCTIPVHLPRPRTSGL